MAQDKLKELASLLEDTQEYLSELVDDLHRQFRYMVTCWQGEKNCPVCKLDDELSGVNKRLEIIRIGLGRQTGETVFAPYWEIVLATGMGDVDNTVTYETLAKYETKEFAYAAFDGINVDIFPDTELQLFFWPSPKGGSLQEVRRSNNDNQ